MDIGQFYDANPARRASEEVEFGRDWMGDEGATRTEISWVRDTGELYAMTAPLEPIVADGAGDEFVQPLPTTSVTVAVLAVIATLDEVEARLAGWKEAMAQSTDLGWIRDRLADASGRREPTS